MNLDPQAASWLSAHTNCPANAFHHVLDNIETDAATGDLSDGVFHGKPRQKEEFEQLGFTELFGHGRNREFFLHDGAAHTVGVHSGTVVGNCDHEHPGAVTSF